MICRSLFPCDDVGRQVYLDITVKVMQKWRTSEKVLEEYGY